MRTVHNYERFHRHILAWASGEIENLIVLGAPGLGKSWAVSNALVNIQKLWFGGRTTALEAYLQIHDFRNQCVVFDDVSALLKDNNFLDLLKGLLEHGPSTIKWNTSTALLEHRPKSFITSSRCLVLLNQIPDKCPHVRAILDRCDVISFEPAKAEIINYMRSNFSQDRELIDMLVELPIANITVRLLQKMRSWRDSEYLSLHTELASECKMNESVSQLLDIMKQFDEQEWSKRYAEIVGKSVRSFQRDKKLADQIIDCYETRQDDRHIQIRAEQPFSMGEVA